MGKIFIREFFPTDNVFKNLSDNDGSTDFLESSKPLSLSEYLLGSLRRDDQLLGVNRIINDCMSKAIINADMLSAMQNQEMFISSGSNLMSYNELSTFFLKDMKVNISENEVASIKEIMTEALHLDHSTDRYKLLATTLTDIESLLTTTISDNLRSIILMDSLQDVGEIAAQSEISKTLFNFESVLSNAISTKITTLSRQLGLVTEIGNEIYSKAVTEVQKDTNILNTVYNQLASSVEGKVSDIYPKLVSGYANITGFGLSADDIYNQIVKIDNTSAIFPFYSTNSIFSIVYESISEKVFDLTSGLIQVFNDMPSVLLEFIVKGWTAIVNYVNVNFPIIARSIRKYFSDSNVFMISPIRSLRCLPIPMFRSKVSDFIHYLNDRSDISALEIFKMAKKSQESSSSYYDLQDYELVKSSFLEIFNVDAFDTLALSKGVISADGGYYVYMEDSYSITEVYREVGLPDEVDLVISIYAKANGFDVPETSEPVKLFSLYGSRLNDENIDPMAVYAGPTYKFDSEPESISEYANYITKDYYKIYYDLFKSFVYSYDSVKYLNSHHIITFDQGQPLDHHSYLIVDYSLLSADTITKMTSDYDFELILMFSDSTISRVNFHGGNDISETNDSFGFAFNSNTLDFVILNDSLDDKVLSALKISSFGPSSDVIVQGESTMLDFKSTASGVYRKTVIQTGDWGEGQQLELYMTDRVNTSNFVNQLLYENLGDSISSVLLNKKYTVFDLMFNGSPESTAHIIELAKSNQHSHYYDMINNPFTSSPTGVCFTHRDLTNYELIFNLKLFSFVSDFWNPAKWEEVRRITAIRESQAIINNLEWTGINPNIPSIAMRKYRSDGWQVYDATDCKLMTSHLIFNYLTIMMKAHLTHSNLLVIMSNKLDSCMQLVTDEYKNSKASQLTKKIVVGAAVLAGVCLLGRYSGKLIASTAAFIGWIKTRKARKTAASTNSIASETLSESTENGIAISAIGDAIKWVAKDMNTGFESIRDQIGQGPSNN